MARYPGATYSLVSLPARGVWIEMGGGSLHPHYHVSLPAREVWIGMARPAPLWGARPVTPREGSADSNARVVRAQIDEIVTPREGSVD